jgi:hypothetical protein
VETASARVEYTPAMVERAPATVGRVAAGAKLLPAMRETAQADCGSISDASVISLGGHKSGPGGVVACPGALGAVAAFYESASSSSMSVIPA